MQKECNQHLYMAVGEMPVADTDCEGFLLEYWQVTEQILVRLVIGILIQLHVVKAGKGKHRDFVTWIYPGLELDLGIDIVRKYRQPEKFEKKLEVGLPDRSYIGGFLTYMATGTDSCLGSPYRSLECLFLRISILEGYVHHGAESSSPVGRERTGIEADFTHQVRVQYADRTTGCALGSEMVDVGNFNSVDEEGILLRGR